MGTGIHSAVVPESSHGSARAVRRYRVLHVIDSLQIGGTERRCLEMLEGMQEREFELHLIFFNGKGALRAEVQAMGISHREIRMGPFGTMQFWRGVRAISDYMREYHIDLVQTYGFYSNVPGILAAKWAGIRAIIAGRRDMGEFLTLPQKAVEQWLWRFATRIVVNATPIKTALMRGGVREDQLTVIHNGVDVARFRPVSAPNPLAGPIVGMVANFRHQKDHVTFLDAAALVLARRPNVRFLLIGSGLLEEEIRQYAGSRGVISEVVFAGEIAGNTLLDAMESLSVSVLSSNCNEGLPNVVLEAMACGKPVVATAVGGVRDAVIDGETGFLVPPCNSQALANKVLWLIDHPEEARQMGLSGRRRVEERFTFAGMQRAWSDLYAEVLRENGVPVPCSR